MQDSDGPTENEDREGDPGKTAVNSWGGDTMTKETSRAARSGSNLSVFTEWRFRVQNTQGNEGPFPEGCSHATDSIITNGGDRLRRPRLGFQSPFPRTICFSSLSDNLDLFVCFKLFVIFIFMLSGTSHIISLALGYLTC